MDETSDGFGGDLVRRARPFLGTVVEVGVEAASFNLIDLAFASIARIHALMSFHNETSDVTKLSRARPGACIELDPATVAVLRIAREVHAASDGLFDITIGKTLVRTGFLPRHDASSSDSLDEYDGTPIDVEILSDRKVRLHRSVLIDLGGIAKGFAVDQAVQVLQMHGAQRGIVNAGGDLRVFGDHSAPVRIRRANGPLSEVLHLRDMAIASSENVNTRTMKLGEVHTPHIGPGGRSVLIDSTISVVASQCAIADALTKVAMINAALANQILSNHQGYVVEISEGAAGMSKIIDRKVKLERWQTALLSLSGMLLWASGSLWLLLHHFGAVEGNFGIQTNPLEPWMMRVHGLVVIPALIGIGGLLVSHLPNGWKYRKQRLTGLLLSSSLVMLVFSGYLLYYSGGDLIREWTSVTHWAIGLGVPLLFGWHRLRHRYKTARRAA